METQNQNSYLENVDEPQSAEIIYLSELLAGPGERTRFIGLENQNPSFSKKIDAYKKRIQSGIWNLTCKEFSPVFDIVFKITNTILNTKNQPEFPREILVEKIQYLSVFECQFLIDGINKAIYPEAYTNLVARMAYLHLIRGFLVKRVEDIKNQGIHRDLLLTNEA